MGNDPNGREIVAMDKRPDQLTRVFQALVIAQGIILVPVLALLVYIVYVPDPAALMDSDPVFPPCYMG
jgi:hypothetical protein